MSRTLARIISNLEHAANMHRTHIIFPHDLDCAYGLEWVEWALRDWRHERLMYALRQPRRTPRGWDSV